MYICHDCNTPFSLPEKITEKHGLNCPPYETISVCPYCKSQNFELKKREFCRYCGVRLPKNKTDYCSDSCEKRGEKLFSKQQNHKQKILNSTIYKAVRQVENYNKEYRTRLSYGQFFALYKKKNGGKKNG